MKFKVGDRVKCIREYESNRKIVGTSGTIHSTGGGIIDVDWDVYGGWMVPPEHIQKISTKLKLVNKGNKLQFE